MYWFMCRVYFLSIMVQRHLRIVCDTHFSVWVIRLSFRQKNTIEKPFRTLIYSSSQVSFIIETTTIHEPKDLRLTITFYVKPKLCALGKNGVWYLMSFSFWVSTLNLRGFLYDNKQKNSKHEWLNSNLFHLRFYFTIIVQDIMTRKISHD